MPEDREPGAPEITPSGAPHALIAGAGIAGLASALFLARSGWRITLCDREPVLAEVGAGLQLSPNATRLLNTIGIVDDLDDLAVEPHAMRVRRGLDGELLASARMGSAARARFGAPFLVTHRADLQNALMQRATAHPDITMRLGLRLVDIREGATSIAGLFETAQESAEGAEIRIEADLLIGADGLWSRARSLAGLPAPTRYAGKTAWRALIPREAAPLFAREAEVNLWMGPNAHLVHYPVCGGRDINIVAIIEDDWREEGWSAPGNPDVLAARFRSWCGKARDLVGAAESWQRWALVDRAPEGRWSRARMTLIGDAAHPMMPFLAQGASQGIEDAAVLASLLHAGPREGVPLARALKQYDSIRIPRTARVQKAARRQGGIYHFDGIRAHLRDAALRMLPGEALMQRFAWIYGHDACPLQQQEMTKR
jgi:salicylate hydroxylase